jgi:exonuclease I
MAAVRIARPDDLSELAKHFQDGRLKIMIPLYKARNFRDALTSSERAAWDTYCYQKLLSGGKTSLLAKYFDRIKELAATASEGQQQYLLEELHLYGESIVPIDVTN